MGAMPVPMGGTSTMPMSGLKAAGTGGGGQGGVQGLGGQLYAGKTNATGSPMPINTTPQAASGGMNVSANPGGGSPTNVPGLNPADSSRLLGENQNYYGQGVGALVTNYLNTGAGYNGALAQQTVNATDNAMQQQINQQYGGLQTSLSNAGLSPNSSASALASGEFLSNASAQENQVAAQQYTQMYSQSQQDYLAAMQMVAGVNNQGTINQKTTMGQIGSFLTGGLTGSLQYNSPAAGQAGQVSSSSGPLSVLADLF
jgi:hypothetical protein